MIIFDLEWNRGYDKEPLHEILQIGAVRVEKLGGPITDVFDAYIKPVVHRRFDVGACALPELREYKARGVQFEQALEDFRRWCAGEAVFASWGGGDLDTLQENCAYWDVSPLQAEKVYDLQSAFAHMLGAEQSIALQRAAAYCRIPDTFTFHNARNDAMYAALVGVWLTQEDLDYVPGRKVHLRFCELLFPRQPRRKVGPLPRAEQLLDAQVSRKPPCPICGRAGVVARWCSRRREKKEGQYFGVFSCPAHGRFLCRLSIAQTEEGMWIGRRAVPALTPEVIQEYAAAAGEEVYICKGKRRRRRWRRGGADQGRGPASIKLK